MDKIRVPEGMLMAARKRWPESATGESVIRDRLEAALKWLSENPIEPSNDDLWKMGDEARECLDGGHWTYHVCTEWQRRMFLEPAPPAKSQGFEETWNSLTVEINRVGMNKAIYILRQASGGE